MIIIQRAYDAQGKDVTEIPHEAVRVAWNGDVCTCYMAGDELPPVPDNNAGED